MLAIGRALARDVKLLLLDEPYEGLAPVIVQEIERTLSEIKSLGMTTIIVEQNAIAALKLADRAIILDMGHVVFDGTAEEVLPERQPASGVPRPLKRQARGPGGRRGRRVASRHASTRVCFPVDK